MWKCNLYAGITQPFEEAFSTHSLVNELRAQNPRYDVRVEKMHTKQLDYRYCGYVIAAIIAIIVAYNFPRMFKRGLEAWTERPG